MDYQSVIAAGPGWTQVLGPDGQTYTVRGDRAARNYNPGNLMFGDFARRHGAIGTDGRFAVFPDRATGLKAQEALIFGNERYADLTLRDAIARYAPPNENNTSRYQNAVANATGISLDTKMRDIPETARQSVLSAMHEVEGNKPASIYDARDQLVGYAGQARQSSPALDAISNMADTVGRGLARGLEALTPNGLRGLGSTSLGAYDRSNLDPSISSVADQLASQVALGYLPDITVNSGYRSPDRNRAAGGASRSQHLSGRALDLNISGLNEAQKTQALDTAVEAGAKGIGIYPGERTLHVDTRPSPAMWGQVPGATYAGMSVSQAPAWAQETLAHLQGAGQFAVTPRTTAPTPTARPEMFAAPVSPVERAALPSIQDRSLASQYQGLASSLGAAGVRGLGAMPGPVAAPSLPAPVEVPNYQVASVPPSIPAPAPVAPVAAVAPPAPVEPAPAPQQREKPGLGGRLGKAALGGLSGGIPGAVAGFFQPEIAGLGRSIGGGIGRGLGGLFDGMGNPFDGAPNVGGIAAFGNPAAASPYANAGFFGRQGFVPDEPGTAFMGLAGMQGLGGLSPDHSPGQGGGGLGGFFGGLFG